MPITKDKRDIVINTKVAATNADASDVTSDLDINFSSSAGTVLYFKDALPTDPKERSRHRIEFLDATGTKLGEIAVKYVVKSNADTQTYLVEQTMGRSIFDPQPAGTKAGLPRDPEVAFERTWQQCIKDSGGADAFKQVAKLDARFDLEDTRTYSVSQTVQSADNNTVVVAYAMTDQSGTTLASGTVSMTATSTATAPFSLGDITVVDDPGN